MAGTVGRPSEYSQDIADEICERLIEGESLRSICLKDEMPSKATVCRWLASNEAFRDQYAHAREFQADTLFDESLDIADERNNDLTQPDLVQRARLRIDTRKWMAGKLRPKKYGEKVLNEHSGPDGAPINTVSRVERHVIDPKDTDR
jgi:hypothetical protein